jgi:hypothetical protein
MPSFKMDFNRCLLTISVKAFSTAPVLLVLPVISMTLAKVSSSMCMVIFMIKVWHACHTLLKYFFCAPSKG